MTEAALHAALTPTALILLVHAVAGPPLGTAATVAILLSFGVEGANHSPAEALVLAAQIVASPVVLIGYPVGILPALAAGFAVLRSARAGRRWARIGAGTAAGSISSAIGTAILMIPTVLERGLPELLGVVIVAATMAAIGALAATVCALLTLPIRVAPPP